MDQSGTATQQNPAANPQFPWGCPPFQHSTLDAALSNSFTPDDSYSYTPTATTDTPTSSYNPNYSNSPHDFTQVLTPYLQNDESDGVNNQWCFNSSNDLNKLTQPEGLEFNAAQYMSTSTRRCYEDQHNLNQGSLPSFTSHARPFSTEGDDHSWTSLLFDIQEATWSQDQTAAQLINSTELTGRGMDYDGTHALPFNLPTPLVPIHPRDDLNYNEIQPKCRSFSPHGVTVLKNEHSFQEFHELSMDPTSRSSQFASHNSIEYAQRAPSEYLQCPEHYANIWQWTASHPCDFRSNGQISTSTLPTIPSRPGRHADKRKSDVTKSLHSTQITAQQKSLAKPIMTPSVPKVRIFSCKPYHRRMFLPRKRLIDE